MTAQILFLFSLLTVMIALFLTQRLPYDLVALAGLLILIFTGYLDTDKAFIGFSSPAVITLIVTYFVGVAFINTGISGAIGQAIYRTVGAKEVSIVIAIMLVAGSISAFMSNVTVVVILMPAVASLARRTGISPSRLFIPLTFSVMLGGTITLMGTGPNILISDLLSKHGLEPFHLFDFSALGILLLLSGVLFIAFLGRHLLPNKDPGNADGRNANISEIYKLKERLFSIRIPPGSELDGKTLGALHLGAALSIGVVAISRGDRRVYAPTANDVLHGNDVLIVRGKYAELEKRLSLKNLHVQNLSFQELSDVARGLHNAVISLPSGSALIGKSLQEIDFRKRFGVIVLQIKQNGTVHHKNLAQYRVKLGDKLEVLGPQLQVELLSNEKELSIHRDESVDLRKVHEHLFLLAVSSDSTFIGKTIEELDLGRSVGLTLVGIVRNHALISAFERNEKVQAADELLVSGDPAEMLKLLSFKDLELRSELPSSELESEEVGVVEASLSPRSELVGKSLIDLNFREKYGLQVLAIWRNGEPIRSNLRELPFKFGDALLLLGSRGKIAQLGSDPNFVLLTEVRQPPRRPEKAPLAILSFLVFVALVAFNIQPTHVAALTAAVILVLTRVVSMEEVYRAVDWRIVFLMAALIPIGGVMEDSGGAKLIAESLISLLYPYGPYALLVGFFFLSSFISQVLDSSIAAILLAPIALQTAHTLNSNPYPLAMCVALAASMSFLTPFSARTNLLVMGAGGYKSIDYFKVGLPLTLLTMVILVIAIPIFFPF